MIDFKDPRYVEYNIKDNKLFCEEIDINKITKKKTFSNINLKIIENSDIEKMEKNCFVINKWVHECKDLNHLQRSYLMFTYLRLGLDGEKRLIEIIKTKDHYNENKTRIQIDNYKKRDKFLGVSCQTLIKNGFCNYKNCPNYESSSNRLCKEKRRKSTSK